MAKSINYNGTFGFDSLAETGELIVGSIGEQGYMTIATEASDLPVATLTGTVYATYAYLEWVVV